ncbi:MAG: hypothetical protein ACOC41_07695, partial [Chitinivibrionales bacterium]
MKKILITAILLTMTAALGAQNKIPLSEQNIINISAKGNPTALVDEQDIAGDPLSGASGKPASVFTNGYEFDHIYYPLEVVVDLFARHALSSCHYFDFEGVDTLAVYVGTPKSWRLLFKETTSSYNQWIGHTITDTTRYLLIRVQSPETKITELVLYGEPLEPVETPSEPPAVNHPYPIMKNFIGTNSFVDVPMEFTKAVGFVREYHNWQWDEGNSDTLRRYEGYPNNAYGWNPSWVRGDNWAWNFDDYYSSLKDNDIGVCPTLQKSLPLMVDYNGDSLESKPVIGDDDPTDPASYAAHADWMFQFAARYGSREVDPSLIKTDPLNERRTELGLVSWMENWNEPDKWWKHRAGYFKPFEYAAMTSADYDGDQGRMATTLGLKNADPSMKLAMSGLAGLDLEYVKAMKFWADHFRDGDFPADAINFHHYSNDGGEGQSGTSTQGVSPEDDNLGEKAAALVAYRNRYLPGKEVWVSEFGYDTHQESPIHAPSIGSMDEFTVQGVWIIRSYLELAAAGVDKAMQFVMREKWGPSPGKFSSCGLITANGDTINGSYQPKKSWYYVYTFKKILGEYRFAGDLSTEEVRVYEFEHGRDPLKKIAVLWSPTSSDHTIEGFRLNGLPQTVVEKRFVEYDTLPAEQVLNADNGKVFFTVSEIPTFVEYTTGEVSVTQRNNRSHSAMLTLGSAVQSQNRLALNINVAAEGEL